MSTGYDYRPGAPLRQNVGEDGVPFGNSSDADADNFEIADVSAPADRSADQIDRENARRQIPPGRRLLEVAGFRGAPELKNIRVSLGERLTSYNAYRVKVRLAWTDDPAATVEDNFLLPPDDPAELQAYYYGLPADAKPGSQPGFEASKFIHFIDRLGFPFPPGGKLPPEGRKLVNWKKRRIVGEIQPGKPWTGNDGQPREGYPQVKLFSYEPVAAWAHGASGAGHAQATQQGQAQAARGGLPPAKPLGGAGAPVAAGAPRQPIRGLDSV